MKAQSLTLVAILMFGTAVHAGEDHVTAPIRRHELAMQANMVAVAQLKDTDYV